MRKRAQVGAAAQAEFNTRLILNHLVGQGDEAPEEVVRATLLVLANGFARGASLAGPALAQRVVDALNERRQLRVRLLGSTGQADLSALADLAHDLLGEDGRLEPGEGLALLGNNAFATGFAALAVADLGRLLEAALVAGSLDLEAFAANLDSIHPAIGRERPFPGLADRTRGSSASSSPAAGSSSRAPRATSRIRSRSAACPRCTEPPSTPSASRGRRSSSS